MRHQHFLILAPSPQMSSCYLLAMEKDSIEGIYNTLKDCALISKWAGGIGLHMSNVEHLVVISEELMELVMELFLC